MFSYDHPLFSTEGCFKAYIVVVWVEGENKKYIAFVISIGYKKQRLLIYQ